MMQLTPNVRRFLGLDEFDAQADPASIGAPEPPPAYDSRDADSGPWEAPATLSYNDPTASGTISQPLPAQPRPSYTLVDGRTTPSSGNGDYQPMPLQPTRPAVTLVDGRTAPPTPVGSWEPVQTVPNPQRPPAADPGQWLAEDSQSTPLPPMADYPVQPPGSPYGDQQAAMEPRPDRFDSRPGYGQVQSAGAGEPDYVDSRPQTVTQAIGQGIRSQQGPGGLLEPAAGGARQVARMNEIGQIASRATGKPIGMMALEDPNWRAQNPDLYDEYQELQRQFDMGMLGNLDAPKRVAQGAARAVGPVVREAAEGVAGRVRGVVDDAVQAGSRALRNAGEAAARNVPAGETQLGSGFVPSGGAGTWQVYSRDGDLIHEAASQADAATWARQNARTADIVPPARRPSEEAIAAAREREIQPIVRQAAPEPTDARLGSEFPPEAGRIPPHNFNEPDLETGSGRTTATMIRRHYGGNRKGVEVYESYVPIDDLPAGRIDNGPDGEIDDLGEYMSASRRGFPPIKVRVDEDGKVAILDGNHRIEAWREAGYTHAPVWVVDERGVRQATRRSAQGSGLIPTMSDARNAAQGGVIGAASEMTSDEELTPQERLARMGAGAALGVAAGRTGRGGTRVPGQRRAGSGFLSWGGDDPAAAMRGRVVPPGVADTLDFPIRIPDDPRTIRAIEAAGGSVDPEKGVTLGVTRSQGANAAGGIAHRGGVFYEPIPEGGRSSYAMTSDSARVGGSQTIPRTDTRFRSPLVLDSKHNPNGLNAIDSAFQQLGVRTTDADIDTGIDDALINAGVNNFSHIQSRDELIAVIKGLEDLVARYGGDPSTVSEMIRRLPDDGEIPHAIKENILAHNARRNGYDGVLTVVPGEVDPSVVKNHPEMKAAQQQADLAEGRLADVGTSIYDRNPQKTPEQQQAIFDFWNLRQNVEDTRLRLEKELAEPQIRELMDVREARNPTPGEPDPVKVAEAEAALEDFWNRHPNWDADPAEREEIYRLYETMTRAKEPTPPGYTLRDDIPRRTDVAPSADSRFATPKASGMVPFDPASAAAGAAAGTEVDEDGNPVGVDPLKSSAGMAFAGMAGTPQGRRLVLRSARAAKNTTPPNLLEMMQNFRFSWGMLGNFSTGAVNAMGAPVEIALGLPSEAFRMGILRQRPAAALYQAVELASGLRQGVRDMLGTIVGQVPAAIRNAPDFRPPMSERMQGTAGKAVGHAIELPGRVTSQAPDALWRPMLERWGRAREAGNIMAEAGVSRVRPDEQVKEMHRLLNNPTPDEAARLDKAAKAWADEMGYKGDAGYFEQAIGSLVRPGNRTATANDPLAAQVHEALGSFVMPFFGAVWKLHKLSATRVPVAGGLANRSLKWDEKLSRQVVGATLGLYIADRAAQGLVTGPGPADPDEAALVNKDMPPNSTYVPAVGWVPNDYFGSAGPYLNAIGGYYDARRYATDKEKSDSDKMGERTANDVLRAFQRFPVAQAIQNMVAMVETPTKGVTDFLANAGSSFVPAPAKTYMASQDPLNRTTDRDTGFVDQLTQKTQARTGIMRQELPAAQDRLGRDVENPRQGWAAFGLNIKQAQNDPVIRLLRENNIEPGTPKKELTPSVPGVRSIPPIDLTPKEQRAWNTARGQKLIEYLQPKVSDPGFQALTPAARKANLDKYLSAAGEYADGVIQNQIGGPEITRRINMRRKAS